MSLLYTEKMDFIFNKVGLGKNQPLFGLATKSRKKSTQFSVNKVPIAEKGDVGANANI